MNTLTVQGVELTAREGRPLVSSLDVARHFEKQHKNVLRDITNITADLPAEFTELNFEPSTYQDSTGRELPAYNLTRDGFSLLAMGFTGAKAMKWKVRYIQAFNAMEEKLTQPAASSLEQDMQRKLDKKARFRLNLGCSNFNTTGRDHRNGSIFISSKYCLPDVPGVREAPGEEWYLPEHTSGIFIWRLPCQI